MSWETSPDGLVVETRDDQPGMSLRAEPGFESNAERLQDIITGLRADIAAVGEIVLYTDPDPGYPTNTTSTTAEVVSMRLTVPAASYRRVVRITGTQMFQYSQVESYDVRLYLNSLPRLCEHRTYATPQNIFRTSPLAGTAILDADVPGVVEFRHLRAGGTGLVTPSAGAGSWTIQVETQRITT